MRRRAGLHCLAAAAVVAITCPGPPASEISRARAIEIARPHVSFQPQSIEAERATSAGRAIWRMTFRGRLPGQPPLLFETIIVEVDRRSGEVVSIARS